MLTSSRRTLAFLPLAWTTLSACGGEPAAPSPSLVAEAKLAMTNPTGAAPPFMVTVVVGAVPGAIGACHGVRIAEHWFLTAAHCFADIEPAKGVAIDGFAISASAVHFPPQAWPVPEPTWSTLHPKGTVSPSFDIALMRLDFDPTMPLVNATVVKLWHPADPSAATESLQNQSVFVGGGTNYTVSPNGDVASTPATGQEGVIGAAAGGLVQMDRTPSGLESGDSGGPVFATLGNANPKSLPFGSPCAPAVGSVGETVLLGIHESVVSEDGVPTVDQFVPVYEPKVADWVGQTLAVDEDEDTVCDGIDNCLGVANPSQENCNLLAEAESAWGHGIILGDACDPAPCPAPSARLRTFVPYGPALPAGGSSGGAGGGISPTFDLNTLTLYLRQPGRDIQDTLRLTPILGQGSPPLASGASMRFCSCRDGLQHAIGLPDICVASPYNCFIDPRQVTWDEVSGAVASMQAQKTAWHPVATVTLMPFYAVGATIPLTYPGAAQERRWAYGHDYSAWTAAGWMAPASLNPGDPPGTNLGGGLWGHDDTDRGSEKHNASCIAPSPLVICTIADGYAFGVAPDPIQAKYTMIGSATIVGWGDQPFGLCPPYCPDPAESNGLAVPRGQPILTVPDAAHPILWLSEGGGRDASRMLSPELALVLADPTSLVVPASEPSSVGGGFGPRGVVLQPDPSSGGVSIKGIQYDGAAGFQLVPMEGLSGAVLEAVARYFEAPSPRGDFALAYSRLTDALYVFHGTDTAAPAHGARVWTRAESGWNGRELSEATPEPLDTRAVFSIQDGHLWVLDRGTSPVGVRLRRIRPTSGEITTTHVLASLNDYERFWLATLENGRVVLVAATSSAATPRFTVTVLSAPQRAAGGPIQVGGTATVEKRLLVGPSVAEGVVSVGIEETLANGERILRPRHFTVEDVLTPWPSLQAELETP